MGSLYEDVNLIRKWRSSWKLLHLGIRRRITFLRGNGGESSTEKGLRMKMKFYHPPHGDSIPEHLFKITYIRILYILYFYL
jgi:hypothetical protein